jgi:hypothetical protein
VLEAMLRDVRMVLRVGGEDDGEEKRLNPPGGGEGHGKKIFGLTKIQLPGIKNCQEQYFSSLGGQKFVLYPEEV